eukprot:gene6522-4699_t
MLCVLFARTGWLGECRVYANCSPLPTHPYTPHPLPHTYIHQEQEKDVGRINETDVTLLTFCLSFMFVGEVPKHLSSARWVGVESESESEGERRKEGDASHESRRETRDERRKMPKEPCEAVSCSLRTSAYANPIYSTPPPHRRGKDRHLAQTESLTFAQIIHTYALSPYGQTEKVPAEKN